MSSREFSEWIAFDRVSKIGDDRKDAMMAQLIWTVRHLLGDDKTKPGDFMWFSKSPTEKKKPQTAEEMMAIFHGEANG